MRFKDDLQRHLYYQSQIDYCYWSIKKLSESKEDIHEVTDSLVEIIRRIIKLKSKLNFDTTEDKLKLNELLTFRKSIKNDKD